MTPCRGFDLDHNRFCWGLALSYDGSAFHGAPFDPASTHGPMPGNKLHINNVFCNAKGMYISGLRTGGLLVFDGRRLRLWAELPRGVHNARPWRDGALFNDTHANVVRYATPDSQVAFAVPRFADEQLTHTDLDDSRIARQSFGRGLCPVTDNLIAAGSSPSTIALHDLRARKTVAALTLTYDVRNAIHGLEVWPYA